MGRLYTGFCLINKPNFITNIQSAEFFVKGKIWKFQDALIKVFF
uniref:Uncharacterized protein n=1 Tax=uncultured bacterium contig00019 TaxID=1181510 RepID=A0A806K008_9BACT|nr:hypothetical protein [uncultured bacterium contig00019]